MVLNPPKHSLFRTVLRFCSGDDFRLRGSWCGRGVWRFLGEIDRGDRSRTDDGVDTNGEDDHTDEEDDHSWDGTGDGDGNTVDADAVDVSGIDPGVRSSTGTSEVGVVDVICGIYMYWVDKWRQNKVENKGGGVCDSGWTHGNFWVVRETNVTSIWK